MGGEGREREAEVAAGECGGAREIASPSAVPPLPPMPRPGGQELRGPTEWSNWVMPGRLMAGAYPGAWEDAIHARTLRSILRQGVDCFVCVMAECNQSAPEGLWKAGRAIRPYLPEARQLYQQLRRNSAPADLAYLQLKVVDGSVGPDTKVSAFVDEVEAAFRAGRVLYVHCWGGHGRTGTIISLLLNRLYPGMESGGAMRRVQLAHDQRRYPQGKRSPDTPIQRQQVRRMIERRRKGRVSVADAKARTASSLSRRGGEWWANRKQELRGDVASTAPRAMQPTRHQTLHAPAWKVNLQRAVGL